MAEHGPRIRCLDDRCSARTAPRFYLVRFTPSHMRRALPQPSDAKCASCSSSSSNAPDGFVVTDQRRAHPDANTAFLEMAQLTTEDQARGEPLDRWLGRSDVDLQRADRQPARSTARCGCSRRVLRGELGATDRGRDLGDSLARRQASLASASPSAMSAAGSPPTTGAQRTLPRSVEQLTELIGRVPLKDIVRETTDVIERLCIEAALELTGDNRASAAEMLGLSRQSLYVKLRRFGLARRCRARATTDGTIAHCHRQPRPRSRGDPRTAEADHLVPADVGFGCGVVSSGVAARRPLAGRSSPASCWPGRWSAAPARR